MRTRKYFLWNRLKAWNVIKINSMMTLASILGTLILKGWVHKAYQSKAMLKQIRK